MSKNPKHFMLLSIVAGMALGAASARAAEPTSLGAFGWAATNGGTKGGHGANAAHTYIINNRYELIKALMPDAIIATDGSFTSAVGPDATPKIIYVKGKINLSENAAGKELKFDEYKDAAYDFQTYVNAYKPSVWNANPANWDAVKNRPTLPMGPQEDARLRSAANQARIVKIPVGSNTSLIGMGKNARIIKGQISVGSVKNVVIRNIAFEDAFDYFPEWDPTDSFALDTTKPGCQATFVNANTGPQKCPGGRWNTEYDNVSVVNSTNVWVDHCTFNDGNREDWRFPSVFTAPHIGTDYLVVRHDGTVDVTGTSDFITLSHNIFQNHDKTNLLGNSNTATAANGWGALSITVANNWYENAGQRTPRVRFGKVHVYNNFFFGTIGYLGKDAPTDGSLVPNNRYLYGIGIGNFAKIYAENNAYEVGNAPTKPQGTGAVVDDTVMFYNWYGANAAVNGVVEKTYFYDAGTLLNGKARSITAAAQALAVTQGKSPLESTPTIWKPASSYAYTLIPSNKVKAAVQANAGAGKF